MCVGAVSLFFLWRYAITMSVGRVFFSQAALGLYLWKPLYGNELLSQYFEIYPGVVSCNKGQGPWRVEVCSVPMKRWMGVVLVGSIGWMGCASSHLSKEEHNAAKEESSPRMVESKSAPTFDRDRIAELAVCHRVPEGIEVLERDDFDVVLLGEIHGTVQGPDFVLQSVCGLLQRGRSVHVVVEIGAEEQVSLDTFLNTEGDEQARLAFLQGAHWTRPFQDGRSSRAMFSMLDGFRQLRGVGAPLHVSAIDRGQTAATGATRDEVMAQNIQKRRALIDAEVTLGLLGNLHMHTVLGSPFDPQWRSAGLVLTEQGVRVGAFTMRNAPGEAWVCRGPKPENCGVSRVGGSGKAKVWAVVLDASLAAKGLRGTWQLGVVEASPPAK